MRKTISRWKLPALLVYAQLLFTQHPSAWAIGPNNVLVIASQKSPEGLAVAHEYCDRRGIPRTHIVRTRISPNEHMTAETFQRYVVDLAEAHIDRHGLRNDIAIWVTTAGIPTIIDSSNSSSGYIFHGEIREPLSDPQRVGMYESENPYFDRMASWHRLREFTKGGYLHMHLDAGSLADTRLLIDRSVRVDGTNPSGRVYLFEGEGHRSSRKEAIPPAIRFLSALGIDAEQRPGWKLSQANDVLGWQTGIKSLRADANQYIPGALADHLTSFGGRLENYRGQSPARDFLKAGCSATYGTVVEPYNYPAKFPLAQVYAYYALGFTAVESYWMSVLWPAQGLFLGDPLTRPFETAPEIEVQGLQAGQEVSGNLGLEVTASVPPGSTGIRRCAVLIDDKIVHQRNFQEIPGGTTVSIQVAGREAEYTNASPELIHEYLGKLGAELTKTGLQFAVRPGLIILSLPANLRDDQTLQVRSSSPMVSAEPIGTKPVAGPGSPANSAMAWELKGRSVAGDRIEIRVYEDGKPAGRVAVTATFPRPAGSLVSALWLEGISRLPKGYQIKQELNPSNPAEGIIELVADGDRSAHRPTARIVVERQKGSTLSVAGEGQEVLLAGAGSEGADLRIIRFGIGPPKFRTQPRIDTTNFVDGLHHLHVQAIRGSATETASLKEIPIVIRNGNTRLNVELIQPELRMAQSALTPVAKSALPEGMTGDVRFFVNGQEIPASESRDGTLTMDPSVWGEGRHYIAARIMDGTREILRSDREVEVTIVP